MIKAKGEEEAKKDLELPQMSCFTCKFVMSEGKRVLEEDSTVQQLANLAETVCKDLQPDLKVVKLSILLSDVAVGLPHLFYPFWLVSLFVLSNLVILFYLVILSHFILSLIVLIVILSKQRKRNILSLS